MTQDRQHLDGGVAPLSFSVVIPAYNAAAYIRDTLESVCRQDLSPCEIIVIDDGSEDDTTAIARAASDLVRCERQANAGAAAARNAGIRLARGSHVAFLDADDRWLPHHLSDMADALQRLDVRWCASAYTLTWESTTRPDVARSLDGVTGEAPVPVADYFVACAGAWRVWTSACAVERRFLLAHGGFAEDMHIGEDLDLWFRLALEAPRFGYCPRPSAVYRQIAGSLMHRETDPFDGWYAGLQRMRNVASQVGGDAESRAAPLMRRSANAAARAAGHAADKRRARMLLSEYGNLLSPLVRGRLVMTSMLPPTLTRRLWSLRASR